MSSITRKMTKLESEPAQGHNSDSSDVKRSTMNEYYEWANKGACTKKPVNKSLWISSKPKDKERAKIFCEVCKVREICLRYALENHEKAGVWGGLDFGKEETIDENVLEEIRLAS